MGPGLIAGIAGNDAGGITTYSVMGASTGLTCSGSSRSPSSSWPSSRRWRRGSGVVTGQGLSDLIRDRFGVRPTAFAMVVLLIANVANTVAEFSGAAAALEIFGISRYLVVPIVGVAIWALVIKASYRTVERVFLSVIVVFVAYIVSAILADPGLGPGRPRARHAVVRPRPGGAAAARRGRRHDDHAVHAVLPDERRRREGHRRRRAAARAGRRGRRLDLDQRHRDLHRRRGGGDDRRRGRDDHLGRRCGQGARAGRRPAGRGALRGRAVRGERAGGDDHAAVDGVRDLRGVRLGIRRRQAVRGRPVVLLDLHVRAGRRGAGRAASRASTCCR